MVAGFFNFFVFFFYAYLANILGFCFVFLQGILSEIMNDVSKRKLEQRLKERAARKMR